MASVATDNGKSNVPLKFVPFNSSIHPSFWSELEKKKLNSWRLSTEPRVIYGTYQPASLKDLPPTISVSSDSFDTNNNNENNNNSMVFHKKNHIIAKGILYLVNTIDEFKKLDKKTILKEASEKILNSCTDEGTEPHYTFVLLVHADVKKHKYIYWFGFPAWIYDNNNNATTTTVVESKKLTSDEKQLMINLIEENEKINNSNATLYPLYILHENKLLSIQTDHVKIKELTNKNSWEMFNTKLIFLDPSSSGKHPGWPLRVFLDIPNQRFHFQIETMNVFCLRGDILSSNMGHGSGIVPESISLVLNHVVSDVENAKKTFLGWELNNKKRAIPRRADLGATMDPSHLAMSSADLNVKLMRWRMLPNLDTDAISNLKCLLLGAGTLGCAVARTLMGWGVRDITFVDNGTVSYSNPVRQSLFTFEDCKTSTYKSTAAANALKQILPGMRSNGIIMTIPMPGHGYKANSKSELEARDSIKQLETLIDEHDVIFLGTDTRESRWLPTCICVAKDKMCINVALGFDNYLVMRHGGGIVGKKNKVTATEKNDANTNVHNDDEQKGTNTSAVSDKNKQQQQQNISTTTRLGCYFCADIVAPGDSLTGRTLDQQCTVTRPGLAPIAAGLAVELCIAMWSHPLKHHASANDTTKSFGVLPHQIRGHLSSFKNTIIEGEAYDKCTACCKEIIDTYTTSGIDFVIDACNDSALLEKKSGLAAMKADMEKMMDDFDIGMEDDGDVDEFGDDDDAILL